MRRALLTVSAQTLCGVLSLRHYGQVPALESRPWPRGEKAPRVSVVVPARDEAENVGRLLQSLHNQDYPNLEVIVVDDRSSDRTAEIARGFSGVRVVQGTEPPPGWTGKAHACMQGAALARGDWLLFVDADTAYRGEAISSAVSYAQARRLDFLSLFLQQECGSFWERLLLPYAYALYFTGAAGRRVNSPGKPDALANGQFMLFRRETYDGVGGHGAVKASVIDDVEMALVLKRRGVAMEVARGEAVGSVRMYRNLGQLRAGFVKNSFSFIQANRRGAPLVIGATVALGSSLPLVASTLGQQDHQHRRRSVLLALAGYGVPAATLAPWYRRFGVAQRYTLLHPLAFVAFQAIALTSAWRTLARRGVTWKGRTYSAGARWRRDRRPYYRLPRRHLAELGLAMVTGQRRLMADDGARLMASLPHPPRVEGSEHIPAERPFCVAANHYQRWGLWIGWEGGLLATEIARRRPHQGNLHLMVVDSTRVGPLMGRTFAVPGTALLYRHVARVWDMVTMPVAPGAQAGRGRALRRLLAIAAPPDGRTGEPIGLFPEGESGDAGGLRPALPGVGAFFLLLGRRGIPVLPAAMFEDEDGLILRFGPPLLVTAREKKAEQADGGAAEQVMQQIAALLPDELHGAYQAK